MRKKYKAPLTMYFIHHTGNIRPYLSHRYYVAANIKTMSCFAHCWRSIGTPQYETLDKLSRYQAVRLDIGNSIAILDGRNSSGSPTTNNDTWETSNGTVASFVSKCPLSTDRLRWRNHFFSSWLSLVPDWGDRVELTEQPTYPMAASWELCGIGGPGILSIDRRTPCNCRA